MLKGLWHSITGKPREDLEYYTGLFEKASADLSARNTAEAEKKLQKIIKDIPRLAAPGPQFMNVLGRAYLVTGHIRRMEHKNGEAVGLYLLALKNMELPGEVINFCAGELAASKLLTPDAVQIYQLYLPGAIEKHETRDPVIQFLKDSLQACFDKNASATQIQNVVQLAQTLLLAVPNLEWALFSLGYSQGRLGNAAEGIGNLKRAEELNPGRFATPFYIGYFYLNSKDYSRAYEALTRSLAIQPNQAEACYLLARAILEPFPDLSAVPAEKIAEAEENLRRAANLSPRQAEYWFDLGRVSAKMGNKQLAAEAYGRAAVLSTGNYTYQIMHAAALIENGQEAEAVKAYRNALSVDSQRFEANFSLAELLYRSGEEGEALNYYLAADRARPGQEGVRIGLGGCHFRQRRYAEAIRYLNPVQNHTRESIFQLARARQLSGDYPGAATAYQTSLQIHPDDSTVFYYLGLAQYRAGLPGEAALALQKALELGASAPLSCAQISNALAIIQLDLGRAEEAVTALAAIPPAEANHPDSIYLLALARIRLGQWKKAEQVLNGSPDLVSQSAGLTLLSAVVLEHKEDWQAAAQAYHRFAAGGSGSKQQVQATVREGICLARAGDTASALPLLQPYGQQDDEVKFWLALALTRSGDLPGALPLWEQLVQAHPDTPQLVEALANVLFQMGDKALAAGDSGEAVRLWGRCQQVLPSAAAQAGLEESYFRQGVHLLKGGAADLPAARAALEAALQLDPDDVRARFYLSVEAVCSQDPQRALQLLENLDEAAWDEQQVEYYRALAHLQQGQIKEAREDLAWIEEHVEALPPTCRLLGASIFAAEQDWGAVVSQLQAGLLQPAAG